MVAEERKEGPGSGESSRGGYFIKSERLGQGSLCFKGWQPGSTFYFWQTFSRESVGEQGCGSAKPGPGVPW